MIKYIPHNNYSSYIEINKDHFLLHRININLLKDISFHINHWLRFIELLKIKNKNLLDIAEEIFSEKRDEYFEKIIWLLLEMATETHTSLVQEYLEYHAYICFKKHWIHRYTYFEYHGFEMRKEVKGNYLRNKLDKGLKRLSNDMQKQISNVINFGINNESLPLRIVPLSKYFAKINFNNSGYKKITVDAHSLHVQQSVYKTQELISKIGEQLRLKGPLNDIAKEFDISASIVIMYAFSIYPHQMKQSIKRFLRIQMLSNQHISLSIALQQHIYQENNLLKKLKKYTPGLYQDLLQLLTKYQKLQINLYKVFNKRVISLYTNQFRIGYIINAKWHSFEIDLDIIKNDTVANDIKQYALYLASNNKVLSTKITDFFQYTRVRTNRFNIDATDIQESDLLSWLKLIGEKRELEDPKADISSFYKYLINIKILSNSSDAKTLQTIYKIISSDLSVEKSKAKNPTKPLPEDVYLQIKNHIDDLPQEIKNAFLIISATGCRPSELASLEKTSLLFDKKLDCYILSINIKKQNTAYGKRGRKPIRKVPIYDQDVISAFYDQVKISEAIRELSGSDSIFIRKYNKRHMIKFHIPSSRELIISINNLIKKYKIKSELDDELWHYTPYQMRSMIATTMVEKGHAPEEIKAFFGWMSTHTPEKAYAYVRNKKLEELNTEFFRNHFKISFDKNLLNTYSRQDKEQMFIELYIHKRQMEYGECIRHPIMGECGKLQTPDSCASCARLITDPRYLITWKKLLNNQQHIFDTLIDSLKSQGIPKNEYETWAEYIIQKHRLDSYKSIVKELSIRKEDTCHK